MAPPNASSIRSIAMRISGVDCIAYQAATLTGLDHDRVRASMTMRSCPRQSKSALSGSSSPSKMCSKRSRGFAREGVHDGELVGEEPVDRSHRDVGPGRDRSDVEGLRALLDQQVARGSEDGRDSVPAAGLLRDAPRGQAQQALPRAACSSCGAGERGAIRADSSEVYLAQLVERPDRRIPERQVMATWCIGAPRRWSP